MAKTKNILALIEADHRKVEELFAELEGTKDAKKGQKIFAQIYKELNLHSKAEELVFYPAMQEYDETQEYIEEAEEEHTSVKILLEEMMALKPNDAEFQTKMQQLKEAVTHHVEEEESEIFEVVRECMDDEELEELAQEFTEAKTRLESDVQIAKV